MRACPSCCHRQRPRALAPAAATAKGCALAILVGPVRYSWEKLARRRRQLCKATTTAAVANRARAICRQYAGFQPFSGQAAITENRKAPARRASRHRLGTRRRRKGNGLLLVLMTADQTALAATMLTHNDPITSKDNPITSKNNFGLTFFNKLLPV